MMQNIFLPLRAFAPDLVVVSAGFDAHAHDALEAGGLHDRDYEWMTSELMRIGEACAGGRVVSVLEGGYGSWQFAKESATGYTLSREGLAENVAAHLSALAGVRCHAD